MLWEAGLYLYSNFFSPYTQSYLMPVKKYIKSRKSHWVCQCLGTAQWASRYRLYWCVTWLKKDTERWEQYLSSGCYWCNRRIKGHFFHTVCLKKFCSRPTVKKQWKKNGIRQTQLQLIYHQSKRSASHKPHSPPSSHFRRTPQCIEHQLEEMRSQQLGNNASQSK